MKRTMLLILILLALPLRGQDYTLRDYYGHGDTREIAMRALLREIGASVQFKPQGLLESYSNDISQSAVEITRNGGVDLMLSGNSLDEIFRSRQNRAQSILNEGRRSSNDSFRMTYYRWAWYYISSLPVGREISGKREIEKWIQSHPDIKPGKLPVPMTHIEREIEKIRSILGEIGSSKPISSEKESQKSWKAPVEKGKKETTLKEERHRNDPLLSSTDTPVFFLPEIIFKGKTNYIPFSKTIRQYPAPNGVDPLRVSLLASIGLSPETIYGSTLSIRRKWGIIAGCNTNFKSDISSYKALSSGNRINADTFLWPNGNTIVKHFKLSAGFSREILPWMDCFIMAGYGERSIYWQDTDDEWAMISDLSCRGLAISSGLILGYGHFCGIIEAGSVCFQTLGLSFGLGYTF